MFRRFFPLLIFSIGFGVSQDAAHGERYAVLVGNAHYSHLKPLASVPDNIQVLEGALKDAGFTVRAFSDANFQNLYDGVISGSYFSGVKPGDVCFFYYAGYAFAPQTATDNYLVPTDFDAATREDINHGAFSLSRVQDALDSAKARIKIIVIDGSTDVGKYVSTLGLGRGFAFPDRGDSKEIMIAFSASPTEPASYPASGVTPFTKYLAAAMSKPGSTIEAVFNEAQREVVKSTPTQVPHLSTNITETFYFHDPLPVKAELPAGVPKQNRKDRQEYVWIPSGKFLMGCVPSDTKCNDDEKPQHAVTITKGFWMGTTEVTANAYSGYLENAFDKKDKKHRKMPEAPVWNEKWKTTNEPISSVKWEEAKSFCEWAGGRLPTEAEWEYAARAGKDNEIYPLNSENSRDKANFLGQQGNDRYKFAAPVGSFDRSAFGLFDMSGNLWEWVNDWYDKSYYAESPPADPPGPSSGTKHIMRGGSFDSAADKHLRISLRKPTNDSGNALGFRCVLDDTPATKKLLQ